MLTLSIDVTKIDKSRLKDGKNRAKYLSLTLHANRDGADKFGNTHFVTQSPTKEERASKIRMPIIGNAKDWDAQPAAAPADVPAPKGRPF